MSEVLSGQFESEEADIEEHRDIRIVLFQAESGLWTMWTMEKMYIKGSSRGESTVGVVDRR